MINDVNKDRQQVIRAVRAQLQSMFSRAAGSSAWGHLRQHMAARIEALEGELDEHHRALHAEDPVSGSSYRLILSDLIGLNEDGRCPIDVPALRTGLGAMNLAELAALQETCGPLAIGPADANARGIADGDVVRVFNGRGACFAGVRISDTLRPGVVRLSCGAWYDPADEADNASCAHGNANILTRDQGTSRLSQRPGSATALVQVERCTEAPPPVGAFAAPRLQGA